MGSSRGNGNFEVLVQQVMLRVGNLEWRTKFALVTSAFFDGMYAVFALFINRFDATSAMFLLGVYYLAIAVISVCLIVGFVFSKRAENQDARFASELHSSVVGGVALLVLNSIMVRITQSVLEGWSGIRYKDIVFYVMLIYALLTVFFGIMGWRRHHDHPSPIIATCKGMSLCKSLMTLLFVLVAAAHRRAPLLPDDSFLRLFLGTTSQYLGIGASVVSLVIAIFTIVHSRRELKALRAES